MAALMASALTLGVCAENAPARRQFVPVGEIAEAARKIESGTARSSRTVFATARPLGAQRAAKVQTPKPAGRPLPLASAPAAGASGNIPDLRGCVVYADSWSQAYKPYGLYRISPTGTATAFLGPNAQYGGVVVNRVSMPPSIMSTRVSTMWWSTPMMLTPAHIWATMREL